MSKSQLNTNTTSLLELFLQLPEEQKKEIASLFFQNLNKLKEVLPEQKEKELLLTFLKALIKKQFKYFVMFFVNLIEAQELDFSFHVKVLCEVCQQHSQSNLLYDNDVVVNIPPGHSKTLICNVLYTAWLLGNKPTLRILVRTLSDVVAVETNQKTGTIMTSKAFIEVFGNIVNKALNEYIETSFNGTIGYRRSQSFFMGVLSQNADFILCDDPNDTSENGMIDNANFRNVINTYRSAIATRQRGTDNSLQTFIVQQRVGVYDLSGDILKNAEETNNPVNHIKITAWEDKETDFIIYCKTGNILFKREKGYLWLPKSEKMLKNRLNLYETMRRNAYLWSSQYQQDPSDSTLAIIPLDYFNEYEEEPEELPISSTFITCDIAFAGITTPDRTCLCCWGMSDNGMLFLIDIIYDKIPAEELPTKIIEFYKRNSLRYFNTNKRSVKKKVFCGRFYIEDIHNEALLPFLKKEIQGIEIVKRGGNTKAMRITEALPVISQKVVYLPIKRFFKEISGIKEELRQLTPALLGSVRDDFTDNLCDAINYGRQTAFRVAKLINAYKLMQTSNT